MLATTLDIHGRQDKIWTSSKIASALHKRRCLYNSTSTV